MEKIIEMLESDGITGARLLEYKSKLRHLESEAFLSGRSFEKKGKGNPLPAASRLDSSECDMLKMEQRDFLNKIKQSHE